MASENAVAGGSIAQRAESYGIKSMYPLTEMMSKKCLHTPFQSLKNTIQDSWKTYVYRISHI